MKSSHATFNTRFEAVSPRVAFLNWHVTSHSHALHRLCGVETTRNGLLRSRYRYRCRPGTTAVVQFATLEPTLWRLTVMGPQTRKPLAVAEELILEDLIASDTLAVIIAMTIVMSSALIAALELLRVRLTYLFSRISYLHEYFFPAPNHPRTGAW